MVDTYTFQSAIRDPKTGRYPMLTAVVFRPSIGSVCRRDTCQTIGGRTVQTFTAPSGIKFRTVHETGKPVVTDVL